MTAIPPQILAIDLGTSGVKVTLVAADGTLTGWAEKSIPLAVLPEGGAEQDPLAWWQALREAVAALHREHCEYTSQITVVCASTQGWREVE